MIKLRQPNENIGGDIPLTELIVAVDTLRTIQILRNFALLQVMIFSEIANSLIHQITLITGYHSAICSIDR